MRFIRETQAVCRTAQRILSGSAGLGSRDVRAGDIIGVFENMVADEDTCKTYFTLGIKHETAINGSEHPDLRPKGAFSMRGHSVGGYGSVTTNKLIATLQWLYLNTLDTISTLEKLIVFYVDAHNTRLPHSAFRGQTPDEMYFGTGNDIPAELEAARKSARQLRLETNRKMS